MRATALAVALACVGCVPTISQPRGEEHLAAMRAATRHHHHGRMDEAARAWAEASATAERRVDRDEASYRQARALVRLGRQREAIAVLDAIAEARPVSRRTVRARFDAALLRRELGEIDRAEADLTWIVREHPGSGPASRALRILYENRTDTATKLALLEELHTRVGDTELGDDLLVYRAELLHEGGDRRGAIATLEQLVREHPYPRGARWDEAFARLADFAEEAGDYVGAIEYLRRMIAMHEPTVVPGSQTPSGFPTARLRIARLYRDHLADPVRAEEHYLGTYEQFPTSRLRDDALYELGAMWLERGERERGCEILARVAREFEVGTARRRAQRAIDRNCAR